MSKKFVYNRFEFNVRELKFPEQLEANIKTVLARNKHKLTYSHMIFYGNPDQENPPQGTLCIDIGPTHGFLNSTQREVLIDYIKEGMRMSGLEVLPNRSNPAQVWHGGGALTHLKN